MAASLPDDLLLAIRRQIREFSDSSSFGTPISCPEESVACYKSHISDLQQEIQILESEVQHAKDAQMDNSRFLKKDYKSLTLDESLIEVYGDIELLESKLKICADISGIKFLESRYHVTDLDANNIRRHYYIKSICGATHFAVELDAVENLTSTETAVKIENVEFFLPDSVDDELKADLLKIEAADAVQLLFQVISSYEKQRVYREKVFRCCQEKFSDYVQLPTGPKGQTIKLTNPKLPGIQFTITWKFYLALHYTVQQYIHLEPNFSKKWIKKDNGNLIKNAPAVFDQLLGNNSVEQVIDAFIQLLK